MSSNTTFPEHVLTACRMVLAYTFSCGMLSALAMGLMIGLKPPETR